MRQFIISPCSPEGFGGGLASRQRDVVADAHTTIAILAEASRVSCPMPAQDEGERYDEGLVHNHGWARSSAH